MARQYNLTKNGAPEGADYVTVQPVGMNGIAHAVLVKGAKRGWVAVQRKDWESGAVDGAAQGEGLTTDAAILDLIDRIAERTDGTEPTRENGTEAEQVKDAPVENTPAKPKRKKGKGKKSAPATPGDVTDGTPGNTDRVTAALEAAKRKVAADQENGTDGEGDTPAPAEPVKAAKPKRTRKEAVAVQRAKRDESAPVESDDHNRMTGEVQAAWEEQHAPQVDVVAYAAGLIMNAYRKSAAQCSAAEGSQVPFREAGERVRELIKSVEAAALESGSDAVMGMADDAVVVMGRHLGVITREGTYADPMVAKRAKNRLKRAAYRFHVSV